MTLKLLPWGLCLLLAVVVWGGYGHLKAARERATAAEGRADAAETKLEAAKVRQRELDALLEERERTNTKLDSALAEQERLIMEFRNEDCLNFDTRYQWLDRLLLPDGAEVPEGGR